MGELLPPMNLCVQIGMLKGASITAFNGLGHHTQQACKSWHLDVNRRHAAKLKVLIQCAKEYGCVVELWGDHAHLSEVTDNNSTAREAKQQVNVAQSHTNYQLLMSAEELIGIVNLDKKVDWFHPTTHKRYSFFL
jgi:hypothetical protein